MLSNPDNTRTPSTDADQFNKTERTLIRLYRCLSGRNRRCLWQVAVVLAKATVRRS
jgi:hypothetical protein